MRMAEDERSIRAKKITEAIKTFVRGENCRIIIVGGDPESHEIIETVFRLKRAELEQERTKH
jgi:hypothetical protein